MTRLSEHFTLDELLRNSGEHAAPGYVVLNAQRTAQVLEVIRRQLGDVPIIPTSWYRPPAKNADTLGAVPNSDHLNGYGVDFKVPNMTPAQVVAKLAPYIKTLDVDQLIDERDHVHLSANPRLRRQVLIEIREGEYVPWSPQASVSAAPPAPSLPNMSMPGNGQYKPGTLLWWLALAAVLIPAILNFLTKSSTPAP